MTDIIKKAQDNQVLELLKYSKHNNSQSTQKTTFYSLWDFVKFYAELEDFEVDHSSKDKEISRVMENFTRLNGIQAKLLVTKYLANLEKSGKSTSTISVRLAALRNHVTLCKELLGFPTWDLSFFKPPKVENKKVPGPTEEEFGRLLKKFQEMEKSPKSIDRRDALLCYILAFTGLRVSEALSIDVENINPATRKILISRKGKRLKQDFTLGKVMFSKLESFIMRNHQIEGPLFLNRSGGRLSRESAWRRVKKIGKEIGLKNLHPHKFRHFATTEALEAVDFNVHQAAKFTSHISEEQLKRYEDERANTQEAIASKIEKKWLSQPDN